MSVLQRPLFRAGGGGANKFPDLSGDGQVTQKDILMGRGVLPRKMQEGGIAAMMPETAPAPPPPPVMPDPMATQPPMPMEEPLDPLAQDVLMAREEGEKIGLDYLAQTMDGIDDAADTEQLINAIRGNDRSLTDRVSELASFVGEADARQTPESVLAMVQPTIMMSEEGAIDSGVGGLIQQVLGAAEVEDEMAEGIGSLMVQGQPAPEMAPPMAPPQQFAVGGAVKKFEEGGGATADPGFQTYYDQYLPVYQNLIAESEEERDLDRGLALAKAGFQLASGRDAKGRNIAGSGFLANLASAGEGLIGDIGTLDRERRKSQQAAKTLALQSAFATDQAERSAAARMAEKQYERTTKLLVEEIKQLNKVNIGRFEIAKTGTNIDGEDEFSVLDTTSGTVQGGVLAGQLTGIFNQAARIDAAPADDVAATAVIDDADKRTIGMPRNTPDERDFARFFTKLPTYADGTMNDADLQIFETLIDRRFAPERTDQGISFKENIPVRVAQEIKKRLDAKLPVNINSEIKEKVIELATDPVSTLNTDMEEALKRAEGISILDEDFDASKAFGARTNLASTFAGAANQLRELTELPQIANLDVVQQANLRRNAQEVMKNLATQTLKLFYTDLGSRPLKSVTTLLEQQVSSLQPGVLKTDEDALKAAKILQGEIQSSLLDAQDIIANPKLHPGASVSMARTAQRQGVRLVGAFDDVIASLERGIGLIEDVGPSNPTGSNNLTDSRIARPFQDNSEAVQAAGKMMFGEG